MRSGQRWEEAFFGINALITKPAQSIALWITPFILEKTTFITRASNARAIFLDQPANAIMGLKLFTGVISWIACLLGALHLMWYPLHGKKLVEVQEKVFVLQKQKKQQFEQRENEGEIAI